MRAAFAFAVLIVAGQSLRAQAPSERSQDSLDSVFRFEEPSPFSCLISLFPPFLAGQGVELKSFIRSRRFEDVRNRFGESRAVDAIFVRAMNLTDGNTAMALLIAAIGCFDHRVVGLKVPIVELFFPLSDESLEEFNRRVNHLPSRLYPDTPSGTFGDRDKLQHFFGSAFLTYICESRNAAERFGIFVEEGEDAFIQGGVLDLRDIRANHEGQQFGLALLADNHRMPSQFIRLHIAAAPENVPATVGSPSSYGEGP